MPAQRLRHILNLKKIFPNLKGTPGKILHDLASLENEAFCMALRLCNESVPEGYQDSKEREILVKLDRILSFKESNIPVFINDDPRGKSLKIHERWMFDHVINGPYRLFRDMGGDGLLSPDFE